MERDRARLFASRERQPAVQTPQCRQPGVADWLADGGWSAQGGSRLRQIVLKQPGFRQRRADRDFVFARQRSGAEHRAEQFGSLGPASPFEGGVSPCDRRLD